MSNLLIKGWNHSTLNWDECIDIYNTVIERSKSERVGEIDNNVLLYGEDCIFDMAVARIQLPGYFSCRAHTHKKVQDAMKILNVCDADLYFNISTRAEGFGLHHDEVDGYYWQCIGKVKIIIQGNVFYLEPG